MDEARQILKSHLGDGLKVVEQLSPYTILGVGGHADFFFEAKSAEDLEKAASAAKAAKVPFFILGSGSSVLVSDAGYHGLVIKNLFESIKESPTETPIKVQVEVASGTSLPKLIRYCLDNNFSGLEGLAGIAGTVGGSIVFNSAARGEVISDNLESIKVIDIIGQIRTVPKSDCQFDYGTSRFLGRSEVILSAKFNLLRSDPGTINQKINIALSKISDKPKDPKILEMFMYLSGESPERFIEAVGLSGHKIGGARIMSEHANFIQNMGHATSENIVELVNLAKVKVKEKYYTELRESFLYLGPS